jgi:hypothetical protein
MQWTPRIGLALCLGVVVWLLIPQGARAQLCVSSAECGPGLVCRQGYLGVNWCRPRACNFDRDCPRNQRPCAGGVCAPLPTAGGGGSSSGGSSQGGVGARCGRVEFGGGVVKNIACRRPLVCQFGTCQRPQT